MGNIALRRTDRGYYRTPRAVGLEDRMGMGDLLEQRPERPTSNLAQEVGMERLVSHAVFGSEITEHEAAISETVDQSPYKSGGYNKKPAHRTRAIAGSRRRSEMTEKANDWGEFRIGQAIGRPHLSMKTPEVVPG